VARRKPKYSEKPHIMSEAIAQKFRSFMEPKKAKESKAPWAEPMGGWLLYRWDTLEDVKQD